jgi:carbon-monoxide dehydrogenase large subunit
MPRREDLRLILGQGRYTSDSNLPGQLHAVFLRADRAHAEILRIDVTRSLASPGVKAIYTGDDMREAGYKTLPNPVNYPGRDGQKLRKPFYPVLAQGRVRYLGEPVAMVIAGSAADAETARELIEVEYRDLPAVIGFNAALAADTTPIHADASGNLAFEYESGDRAAVEAATVTQLQLAPGP